MIKRKHWNLFSKAVLLVLIFLLASEPVLVAAKPQEVDPRQEALDTLTASGDLYLTNAVEAVSLSTELMKSVSAIESTPLAQVSENAVAQARSRALQGAEASAITLGSIDDLSTSVESLASSLYPNFDPFQRAAEGVPQQLRDDLIQEAGLSSADVDAISGGMDDILLERQSMATNGMPAEIAAQLSAAGFSPAEIDQLAIVVGTRGLANTSLTTTLAQFRASQDEWADVRTHLLILNVQLMGYQIGTRQANGIEPRAVTQAELQEITNDELRLLVHVAHLQALWGTDPDLEIGEGDWWFIEHYAGRAAERLDALVIDSQNRGLVQDLYVLQEMKLLALTARNGDAQYVKAELDGLGEMLSYLVGDETFISKQRDGLRGLSYVAARLASHPNVREKVQWPVDEEARSGAAKNAQVRMEAMGVENLAPSFGVIPEQNENNNLKSLTFMAGLSYFDQKMAALLNEILKVVIDINQQSLADLIKAVLTGDTDNPLLMGTNMLLGMIPVVNVLTDLFSLLVMPGIWMKALLFFALVNDIGESLAWLPTLQVAGVTYVAGAATDAIKRLTIKATTVVQKILNGMKFAKAFDIIVQLVKVIGNYITEAVHSIGEAFQVLWDLLTGNFKIWDNFVTFVKRVGTDGLTRLGFDEGSMLVGRILNLGVDLSDETLVALKTVSNDLVAAGVKLSDEAAAGLGKMATSMEPDKFKRVVNALRSSCIGMTNRAPKRARIVKPQGSCVLPATIFTSYQRFDKATLDALEQLTEKVDINDFMALLSKFAADPDNLDLAKYIFKVLGDPLVDADAVRIAMKQGPEGAEVLSLWAKPDNPGNPIKTILRDQDLAGDLAQRAAKDVDTWKRMANWQVGQMPDDATLRAIGINSRDGHGGFWAIGKNEGYNDGFAKLARENNGQFYFTHPEVGAKVNAIFPNDAAKRDEIFWKINEAALADDTLGNSPIKQKLPFKYSMNGLGDQLQNEKDAIKAFKNGMSVEDVEARYFGGDFNFRMRELDLLIKNGYTLPDDIDNIGLVFWIKR